MTAFYLLPPYVAFLHGCILFFSHLYGKSICPYPIGTGSKKAAVQSIPEDAKDRSTLCRSSANSAGNPLGFAFD